MSFKASYPPIRNWVSVAAEFDAIAGVYDYFPVAARKMAQAFLEHLPLPGYNKRILDIGCGTGRTLLALTPYFEEAYGIDISSRMLSLVRKRCVRDSRNVKLVRMNVDKLAFSAESFDYVISYATLHHVNDLIVPLREIKRVVRPGGRIVIVDIVNKGMTGWCPIFTVKLLAATTFVKDLVRSGYRFAYRNYRCIMPKEWINHLQSERYIEREHLYWACSEIMPGARIYTFRKELGLTVLAKIVWDKPLNTIVGLTR